VVQKWERNSCWAGALAPLLTWILVLPWLGVGVILREDEEFPDQPQL
jgi:hypothetical protein